MKKIFFTLLSFLSLATISSQKPYKLLKEIPIPLCCHLDAYYYEYSSLAKWKDKILLIPQRPGERRLNDADYIGDAPVKAHALDISDISTNRYHEVTKVSVLNFTNLDVLKNIKGYQGIEAVVVLNNSNTIYFAIETDSSIDSCFIIKGVIDPEKFEITVGNIISLPKPAGWKDNDNAGFESLTYLQAKNKLIAFFEQNNQISIDRAFVIDTALSSYQTLEFKTQLLFRLTDVVQLENSDTLLGINHYYNDYNSSSVEFKYYIGSTNVENAKKEMSGEDPCSLSFTRIIKLFLTSDNKIDWKPISEPVSFSDDNWEGILPFKDGVLMVVDGVPPGQPCKLSYFKLK
jgi:hypothetical protein